MEDAMERLATVATRTRRGRQVHVLFALVAIVTLQMVGLLVLL
jgi:hypothetical protein